MKKQISKRTAIIVGLVAGGLFFGLIGYVVLVAPQKAELGTVSSQLGVARTALASAQAKQPVRQAIPAKATDLFRLTSAMPDSDQLPSLLLDLSQLAKSNSLAVTSLQPSASVAGTVFTTIPVSMQVSGTYIDVKRFLHAMRTRVRVDGDTPHVAGRLFIPTSINLSAGTGKAVDATLSLNAYVYGSPDAPPPAPVVATTTTTTTTTG